MPIIVHLLFALISSQTSSYTLLQHSFVENPLTIVEMDQVFGLQEGETAQLTDKNVLIQVNKISDSRCPTGVNCIRAGELEISISVTIEDEVLSYTLRNPTWERGGSAETVVDNGLTIRLQGEYKQEARTKGDPIAVALVFTKSQSEKDSPKND